MEKNKYIEVIDRYNQLFTEREISKKLTNSTRKVDKMEKNKYIEVIDHYNQLFTEREISWVTAWWATHAVILCAMKDDRITADDYCYLSGYRDELLEKG